MSGPSARLRTFLLSQVSESTRGKYAAALGDFAQWSRLLQVVWSSLPEEPLDFLLADYILDGRDAGASLQAYANAVAAVHKHFGHRRRFTAAHKTLEAWRRELPVNQAPPMPADVAFASVSILQLCGHLHAAMVVLLCFCGLLRINEALQLCREDVILTRLPDGSQACILLLRKSKRGVADSEKVVLADRRVIRYIEVYLRATPGRPHAKLCAISYMAIQKHLLRLSKFFGFERTTFRSHSLRRGGATALSMQGLSLHEIMAIGRWAAEKSARLYIAKAEVLILRFRDSRLPEHARRIQLLAPLGERLFELKYI